MVIVAVPDCEVAGVTVMLRLAPLPLKLMLAFGTSVGFDETAEFFRRAEGDVHGHAVHGVDTALLTHHLVRLGIQLVELDDLPVLHERFLEIADPLVINREREMIVRPRYDVCSRRIRQRRGRRGASRRRRQGIGSVRTPGHLYNRLRRARLV